MLSLYTCCVFCTPKYIDLVLCTINTSNNIYSTHLSQYRQIIVFRKIDKTKTLKLVRKLASGFDIWATCVWPSVIELNRSLICVNRSRYQNKLHDKIIKFFPIVVFLSCKIDILKLCFPKNQ